MSDMLTDPLWKAEHLGRSIPDSPHAVSACLPTWLDCVGYEEQEPRVVSKLTTGYPRFVYNRLCRELFEPDRRGQAPHQRTTQVTPCCASRSPTSVAGWPL